jgi:hypothetical protein
MIKKSAVSSSIFGALFFLLVPFPVNADEFVELPPIETHDISLQIRAMAGGVLYEYKDSALPVEDVSDYVFLRGIGTRINYDNFFADIYYQDSNTGSEHMINGNNHPSVNFSRRDWAITGGYTFLENNRFLGDISVFGGYKNGQTSVNTIQTILQTRPTNDGEITVFTATESKAHFKATDYFLGLANSWRINSLPWVNNWRWIKNGRLGFNVAVARLKGEYTSDSKTRTEVFPTDPTVIQSPGDESFTAPTTGWRFGLNWSYPISNEFAYTISLEYYNYRMEKIREILDFSVDEEFFGIKASLVYTFDPRKLW